MQSWVKGAVFHLENVLGAGSDAQSNAVAVLWSPLEGAEDDHVQRALEQFNTIFVAFPGRHGEEVEDNLPQRWSEIYPLNSHTKNSYGAPRLCAQSAG
jgi:hypothetical protein